MESEVNLTPFLFGESPSYRVYMAKIAGEKK